MSTTEGWINEPPHWYTSLVLPVVAETVGRNTATIHGNSPYCDSLSLKFVMRTLRPSALRTPQVEMYLGPNGTGGTISAMGWEVGILQQTSIDPGQLPPTSSAGGGGPTSLFVTGLDSAVTLAGGFLRMSIIPAPSVMIWPSLHR